MFQQALEIIMIVCFVVLIVVPIHNYIVVNRQIEEDRALRRSQQ